MRTRPHARQHAEGPGVLPRMCPGLRLFGVREQDSAAPRSYWPGTAITRCLAASPSVGVRPRRLRAVNSARGSKTLRGANRAVNDSGGRGAAIPKIRRIQTTVNTAKGGRPRKRTFDEERELLDGLLEYKEDTHSKTDKEAIAKLAVEWGKRVGASRAVQAKKAKQICKDFSKIRRKFGLPLRGKSRKPRQEIARISPPFLRLPIVYAVSVGPTWPSCTEMENAIDREAPAVLTAQGSAEVSALQRSRSRSLHTPRSDGGAVRSLAAIRNRADHRGEDRRQVG